MLCAGRRILAMALAGIILLALTAHGSWGVWRQRDQEMERQRQLLQSLVQADARWQVPDSAASADDEAEEALGGKVLNSGHVNWYWIPSNTEPSTPRQPRLIYPKAAGLSPLVLDHVFTGEGQQGWANVHALENGELLTGKMQLKHLPPPTPPPERHVDPTCPPSTPLPHWGLRNRSCDAHTVAGVVNSRAFCKILLHNHSINIK